MKITTLKIIALKTAAPMLVAGCCLAVVGCSGSSAPTEPAESVAASAQTSAPAEEVPADSAGSDAAAAAAAAALGIQLTPDNTKIQFVGLHTGDEPNPRTGHFQQFTGVAMVDEGQLKAITVEIDAASLTTEIDKLTNHLKNADFFDVNQYPQAKFETTAIAPKEEGVVEITGDLTLLETTRSVTFPATVILEDGLKLNAEFPIDRTQWGMDYGLDKIEKEVKMTIAVDG